MPLQHFPHRQVKEMHEDTLVLAAAQHSVQCLLRTGSNVDILEFMIRNCFIGTQPENIALNVTFPIGAHPAVYEAVAI